MAAAHAWPGGAALWQIALPGLLQAAGRLPVTLALLHHTPFPVARNPLPSKLFVDSAALLQLIPLPIKVQHTPRRKHCCEAATSLRH